MSKIDWGGATSETFLLQTCVHTNKSRLRSFAPSQIIFNAIITDSRYSLFTIRIKQITYYSH